MKCDTCGKESARLARVVIDQGYNRSMAKPLWNCPDCFAKKEQARRSKAQAAAANGADKTPTGS